MPVIWSSFVRNAGVRRRWTRCVRRWCDGQRKADPPGQAAGRPFRFPRLHPERLPRQGRPPQLRTRPSKESVRRPKAGYPRGQVVGLERQELGESDRRTESDDPRLGGFQPRSGKHYLQEHSGHRATATPLWKCRRPSGPGNSTDKLPDTATATESFPAASWHASVGRSARSSAASGS